MTNDIVDQRIQRTLRHVIVLFKLARVTAQGCTSRANQCITAAIVSGKLAQPAWVGGLICGQCLAILLALERQTRGYNRKQLFTGLGCITGSGDQVIANAHQVQSATE